MIYQGSNLIISADGVVIGGSKSCSVDVQADLIKVSSSTDGQWEHNIAGRKSWSISTNHLLISSEKATATIEAQSYGKGMQNPPAVKIGNAVVDMAISRGFIIYSVSYNAGAYTIGVGPIFDTFGTTSSAGSTACDTMANYLTGTWGPQHKDDWTVILSFGGYSINSTLQTALGNLFGLELPINVTARQNGAVAILGNIYDQLGYYSYVPSSAPVVATTNTIHLNGMTPLQKQLMRDFLLRSGKTFELKMSVMGMVYDHLSGTAICKTAKLQGTKGNLLTGSLQFEGTGPLT